MDNADNLAAKRPRRESPNPNQCDEPLNRAANVCSQLPLAALKLPHAAIQHLAARGDITTPQLFDAVCVALEKGTHHEVASTMATSPQFRYCLSRMPPRTFTCLAAKPAPSSNPAPRKVIRPQLSYPVVVGDEAFNFSTNAVTVSHRVYVVLEGSPHHVSSKHFSKLKQLGSAYDAPVHVIAPLARFVMVKMSTSISPDPQQPQVAEGSVDEDWILSLRGPGHSDRKTVGGYTHWPHRIDVGPFTNAPKPAAKGEGGEAARQRLSLPAKMFNDAAVSSISFDAVWKAMETIPPHFCSRLANLHFVDFTNLSGVRHFSGHSFTYCGISRLDFRPLQQLQSMFFVIRSCSKLRTVLLGLLPQLQNITACFNECPQLRRIDFSGLQGLTTIGRDVLACHNPQTTAGAEVTIGRLPLLTTIGDSFCSGMGITQLDISGLVALESIGCSFAASCVHLTTLTLGDLPSLVAIDAEFAAECHALSVVHLGSLPQLSSIGDSFLADTVSLAQLDLSRMQCANPCRVGSGLLAGSGVTHSGIGWGAFADSVEPLSVFSIFAVRRRLGDPQAAAYLAAACERHVDQHRDAVSGEGAVLCLRLHIALGYAMRGLDAELEQRGVKAALELGGRMNDRFATLGGVLLSIHHETLLRVETNNAHREFFHWLIALLPNNDAECELLVWLTHYALLDACEDDCGTLIHDAKKAMTTSSNGNMEGTCLDQCRVLGINMDPEIEALYAVYDRLRPEYEHSAQHDACSTAEAGFGDEVMGGVMTALSSIVV